MSQKNTPSQVTESLRATTRRYEAATRRGVAPVVVAATSRRRVKRFTPRRENIQLRYNRAFYVFMKSFLISSVRQTNRRRRHRRAAAGRPATGTGKPPGTAAAGLDPRGKLAWVNYNSGIVYHFCNNFSSSSFESVGNVERCWRI